MDMVEAIQFISSFSESHPIYLHGIVGLLKILLVLLIVHLAFFLVSGNRNYQRTWSLNLRIIEQTIESYKKEGISYDLEISKDRISIRPSSKVNKIPQPPGSKEKPPTSI